MAAAKTERLLNLVICLLATRRPLSVDQIRRAVPGYGDPWADDDTAARRMFERDKEELRGLGVPLETVTDPLFEDEVGYRIAPPAYALPEIRLEPDEAAAVGLAARLWHNASLAAEASSALVKLAAAGADVDRAALAVLEPRVASEPAFDACYQAVRDGQPVEFDYRAAGDAATSPRHVEPWGVVSWRGRWYLVGHDRDRGARRVFRLSRIAGPVTATGPSGQVQPPADVDLLAEVSAIDTEAAIGEARLRVRAGAAWELRRRARSSRPLGPDADEIVVAYADAERLAEQVAGHGADVVALAPAELRAAVVRRLAAAAAPEAGARA